MIGSCTRPQDFALRFIEDLDKNKDDMITRRYAIHLKRIKTNRSMISFCYKGANNPVMRPGLTITDPSAHTSPNVIESEDDVLHLRQLPDFEGCLRPVEAEQLLQYLTVPYMRIPVRLTAHSSHCFIATRRCN